MKEQNEEMKKDLEEKRKLIHQKDDNERHLNDKIDVLNETINKMDDRSISSKENQKQSTEDFINQISSLKKLLSESQIDTQTIQRQLDQSEATKLTLEGEITRIQTENEILDNSQKSLTETIKKLETEKLKIEQEFGTCSENERKLR